jgi:hypothetical protein
MADSMRVALKNLAKETKLSAEKETDVLNKIAFYQISATAAWQSNLLPASDYAKAGQALCENSNNSAQMPVHCGLLAFIPIFAVNDVHSLRAGSLQEDINKAAANPEQLQVLQDEAQQMFNDYRVAISAAVVAKKKVANYQMSDDAVKQINTSLKTLACKNLPRINAIFALAGGRNLPNKALIEQSIAELNAVDTFSCEL